ncbi:hypothetical protein VTK73DRAFT_8040 [Phialemonium thermophilum]|uniref:Uncharacterized protein n=1 Tax=Phialemonium thermophilum TaxID=223376 RepID=A0ABR3WAU8_9PEZI
MRASGLRENIQLGPLGRAYPDPYYQIEGDTPSFLYLIPNGLSYPEEPSWGSRGERYNLVDLSGQFNHDADALDRVVGRDGKSYHSNFATLWRWGEACQNDFAARIQWSLKGNFSEANHQPVAIISLDASESYDPDGDILTFSWFHYMEPTMARGLWDGAMPKIDVVDVDKEIPGKRVELQIPPVEHRPQHPLAVFHIRNPQLSVDRASCPPNMCINT